MKNGTLHSYSDDPDRVSDGLTDRAAYHGADYVSVDFVLHDDHFLEVVVDAEVEELKERYTYQGS